MASTSLCLLFSLCFLFSLSQCTFPIRNHHSFHQLHHGDGTFLQAHQQQHQQQQQQEQQPITHEPQGGGLFMDERCCRGCGPDLPCFGSHCTCQLSKETQHLTVYRLRGCMKSGTLWFDSTVRSLVDLIVCQTPGFTCTSDSEKRTLVVTDIHNQTVWKWGADDAHRHKPRLEKDEGNLVIVRDIRSIVVSAHFWWAKKELPPDTKVTNQTASRFLQESLDFMNFFLKEMCVNDKHALFIHYEDLKQDPLPTVRVIAEYLGLYRFGRITSEALEEVVRLNSVENLKKMENERKLFGTQRPQGGSRSHIRSGTVDGWRKNYDSEILDYVEMELCRHRVMSRYLPVEHCTELYSKKGLNYQDACSSPEVLARQVWRMKLYG